MPASLTERIAGWVSGAPEQDAEFIDMVYHALHRLAAQALAREGAGHTLQTTALLHEAYLSLSQNARSYRDRGHFFATATLCMRHILVDHARRRSAQKRDAGRVLASDFDANPQIVQTLDADIELLALDLALNDLRSHNQRRAEVLQFSYFGGFKREEIADLLAISVRTVDRELRLGEAWLADVLAA